jgi:hypothetical protein
MATYSIFTYLYRADPSEENHCFGFRENGFTALDDAEAIAEVKALIVSMDGKVRQLWLTPKGKRKEILFYHFGEYKIDAPRPVERQA